MISILSFFLTMMMAIKSEAACTVAITVNEAISASTLDYIERAEKLVKEKNCQNIFMRLNTPGGNLVTTRLIVEKILDSKVPYLCLITPSGGHAGSAGAIILQACHVNGGVVATNVGAATPISSTGDKIPEDLRKKLINDTVSWMEGVTKLRGRNLKFSEEIITEAKSYSSEVAQKMGALDILAKTDQDFLQQIEGRKVVIRDNESSSLEIGTIEDFAADVRHKILKFVADPEFAYLLFMASLALLYVEITHPGLIAPGVVGGIGLVLSMVAFHKLDVTWGGLALILLGVGFLVAEIFIPSFGILGIGGLIAVFVGSVFLFDAEVTGYALSLPLIAAVVSVLGAFFLGIGYLALKTIRLKRSDADSDLMTSTGLVVSSEANGHRGQIQIMGEIWSFVSEDSLVPGDAVSVSGRQGLTLNVKKIKS